MWSSTPMTELAATRTVMSRTSRIAVRPRASTSSAMPTVSAASDTQGITWTADFQCRREASSTAVPTVFTAASAIMPSRSNAAVRRVPDRGDRSALRFEGRDNLVNHSGSRIVLCELLAQLGEVGIIRGVRTVLHDLIGPLLGLGDAGGLEGLDELVLRGRVRRDLRRRGHVLRRGGRSRRGGLAARVVPAPTARRDEQPAGEREEKTESRTKDLAHWRSFAVVGGGFQRRDFRDYPTVLPKGTTQVCRDSRNGLGRTTDLLGKAKVPCLHGSRTRGRPAAG